MHTAAEEMVSPSLQAIVDTVRTFGPWGPEYQVLGPSATPYEEPSVHIVLVRTGEELDYGLHEALRDPEA